MTDLVAVGESLVAVRSLGRLAMSAPMSASPAGAEMNVAIGVARLGHSSSLIGVVGDDPAGELVLRTLRAEGVGTSAVRRDPRAPTGVMLVDMPVGMPPVVTYHRSGSAGSRVTDLDVRAGLGTPRILHVSGITPALSSSARSAVDAGIEAAQASGSRISFDVNYRSRLWSRAQASRVLAPIAARADTVIASEDELELVADGTGERERIRSLLALGVAEVVVTRGARGAEHHDSTGVTVCAARPATVVSTIGAGDAFAAGYLSALLDALPVAERLERGAICGALAVSGVGDWEQGPTRTEVDALCSSAPDVVR